MVLGPKEMNWGPVRPPAKAQEQLQPKYMYILQLCLACIWTSPLDSASNFGLLGNI